MTEIKDVIGRLRKNGLAYQGGIRDFVALLDWAAAATGDASPNEHIALAWKAHLETCCAPAGRRGRGPSGDAVGRCCEREDMAHVHGACACAYQTCCPEHGHRCWGSHE